MMVRFPVLSSDRRTLAGSPEAAAASSPPAAAGAESPLPGFDPNFISECWRCNAPVKSSWSVCPGCKVRAVVEVRYSHLRSWPWETHAVISCCLLAAIWHHTLPQPCVFPPQLHFFAPPSPFSSFSSAGILSTYTASERRRRRRSRKAHLKLQPAVP